MITVRVQEAPFDIGRETALLSAAVPECGAVSSFLGIVRSTPDRPITALTLEHYPGMTERALSEICSLALQRFGLLGCAVIHRVGTLHTGEPIVLVLAASRHRRSALDGVGFLIDWLKTEAPFWKKEHLVDGESVWVAAREDDLVAAGKWK